MSPVHIVELASLFVLGFFVWLERRDPHRYATLLLGLALIAAAWVGEDTCIRLYGFYGYSSDWHLTLDRMPLMVALIWPFVIVSDKRVVEAALGRGTPLVPWVTGALVCYDAALMETVSVKAGLWAWTEPGLFGVPLIGILGWGYFAATALWLWERLRGGAKAGIIVLAPLLTHLMLLATWWGGLRWVLRGAWPSWTVVAAGALVSIVLSGIILAKGIRVPLEVMLPRIPAACVFFGLLAGYGRDDLPLVLFVLTFVPPYLLAIRWPGRGLALRADTPPQAERSSGHGPRAGRV